MEKKSKGRPSILELRVGIFVVISTLILAGAIFTLGTTVGLFEPKFHAKTYLDNVSGLKPGDIVLLGGIEIGNVRQVDITAELPDTPLNEQNLRIIEELNVAIPALERSLEASRALLRDLTVEYESALNRLGRQSPQVQRMQEELRDLQSQVRRQEENLRRTRRSWEEARNGLQNIVVHMELRSVYRDLIRRDSDITLGSVGLLGDKYIEISLGRTDVPPPIEVDRVDGWLGSREREVVIIAGTEQAGFQELITGANDILVNFNLLSDRLQSIMERFDEGEGTVAKFFADPSFYNNLNQAVLSARETVEQASAVVQEISRGPGTVPLLIQEREIYDRIAVATDRLERVMTSLEQGQGTLGKLVNDPSLYEHSDRVMANFGKIAARMEAGEGTLGRLSSDERVYEDLSRTLARVAALLDEVEQGKGTLGRLAKDEQLYQNLSQVSSEVIKLLYDFRQDPKKFLTIRFQLF